MIFCVILGTMIVYSPCIMYILALFLFYSRYFVFFSHNDIDQFVCFVFFRHNDIDQFVCFVFFRHDDSVSGLE